MPAYHGFPLATLIAKPEEAINVFDFEPVFFKNVPPAHVGYMASGIDAEAMLRANREAFARYYLRPRRLNDVSTVDTSVEIFGVKYPNPIFICPTGGNKAYHPEGEMAVACAARTGEHLEMVATPVTTSIEDAIAARGAPTRATARPATRRISGRASGASATTPAST